jgi:hypothetical protein
LKDGPFLPFITFSDAALQLPQTGSWSITQQWDRSEDYNA